MTTSEEDALKERTESINHDLNEIAKIYDIGIVASIYLRNEDLANVRTYGELSHIEEWGLIKLIETRMK